MGLSRCSRCPIWCADATHTQNLAKPDPAHPLAGLRSAVHSDARAVDCAMASQGLEIFARATPESDFAKVFSEGHVRQSSTESTVA